MYVQSIRVLGLCTRHKYITFETLITQLDDFILRHCQLLLGLGDYSVSWSNFLVVLFVRLEIFRQANGLDIISNCLLK